MSGSRISSLLRKITVLIVICFCVLPAQAKYGGGTGEPNDPYLIYTAEQMNEIGLNEDDWDKCFKLMTDIDLGQFDGKEGREKYNIIGYASYPPWDPHPFTGVFDGNGHTISNFTYTSPGIRYTGLFGYVDSRGEIKDLGLIDPNVDAGTGRVVGSLVGRNEGTITDCYAQGGSVSGTGSVGGLVGYNEYATISFCYSNSSVLGNRGVGGLIGSNHGTITDCHSAGSISGNKDVGGLVGAVHGTIINCNSNGSVSGNERVGGLVGSNYHGTITSSCATGNVTGTVHVGGLVGYNSDYKISNCYSTGSVTGDDYVGGLVGDTDGTIINCYSTGSIEGDNYVGGLVGSCVYYGNVFASFWDTETSGQTTSNGGIGKTTAEMQMMSTFTDAGWDFENVWWILEGTGYPRLCWEDKYGGGSGRPNDPYLIYTAEQMNTIGACKRDWDKHFKLMADIDLSGYAGTSFNIIGYRVSSSDNKPFTGVFNGNGHTISNFTYTSTDIDYIGLFGYVDDSNAVIKDLGLIAPNVDAGIGRRVGSLLGRLQNGAITGCFAESGSVAGNWNIGGLVGFNRYGTITDSYSSCSVSGVNAIGGLSGSNVSTIINCYSTGSVSGTGRYVGGLVGVNNFRITNSYSTGPVLGNEFVGGLAGDNAGTITNCYVDGSSVAGDYDVGGLVGRNSYQDIISNCYATSSVTGVENVGGLVGYNYNGMVVTSFWDIETSGQATSDGGTGLPTAQMQMMSTFTDAGWDFENIWWILEGTDYPHLWWERMEVPMKLTPGTLNCRSKGGWVKAHFVLPADLTVEDVDSNILGRIDSLGIEADYMDVFVDEDGFVRIEMAFDRAVFCEGLTDSGSVEITVKGFLTNGQYFYGTETIKIK
ncbi:MAG: hypothetical protein GWN67_07980 [Phycisphaerae bacterium]|nr:hypothetical protein [Phycisphaerae bacterium]NIR64684.1 hypothetical protein [candidate division Zixibacteria bacterium]NIP51947.1 hypothetical protein [Phycisphaerae bacterium]NIS51068.1 hypothetical protein [Phycisphaerae bacterium]NIU08683.1 hypothetical protein [Phycisphaerae bacterium]